MDGRSFSDVVKRYSSVEKKISPTSSSPNNNNTTTNTCPTSNNDKEEDATTSVKTQDIKVKAPSFPNRSNIRYGKRSSSIRRIHLKNIMHSQTIAYLAKKKRYDNQYPHSSSSSNCQNNVKGGLPRSRTQSSSSVLSTSPRHNNTNSSAKQPPKLRRCSSAGILENQRLPWHEPKEEEKRSAERFKSHSLPNKPVYWEKLVAAAKAREAELARANDDDEDYLSVDNLGIKDSVVDSAPPRRISSSSSTFASTDNNDSGPMTRVADIVRKHLQQSFKDGTITREMLDTRMQKLDNHISNGSHNQIVDLCSTDDLLSVPSIMIRESSSTTNDTSASNDDPIIQKLLATESSDSEGDDDGNNNTIIEEEKIYEQMYVERRADERKALEYSVKNAHSRGLITESVRSALISLLYRNEIHDLSNFKEVQDVLYLKCHMKPTVTPYDKDDEMLSRDVSHNNLFLRYMHSLSLFDSKEQRRKKFEILLNISRLVDVWISSLELASTSNNGGMYNNSNAAHGAALFPCGSFRLGVSDTDSDIDCVIVAPGFVSREDFFYSFSSMLDGHSDVTGMMMVASSRTPLISVEFQGVQVDILFVQLRYRQFVDRFHVDIDADHILAGFSEDEGALRSLNGPRTSTLILSIVPNRSVFRIVLGSVRYWAKCRGIYSSKLGYLGGISWAIAVAYVCQLYPKALPFNLFCRFFNIMAYWPWSERALTLTVPYDAGFGLRMWSREPYNAASCLMPILTPCYPTMNSSAGVGRTGKAMLQAEFMRANELCQMVAFRGVNVVDDINNAGPDPLPILFEKSNFFIKYDHYVAIEFHAPDASELFSWTKTVEFIISTNYGVSAEYHVHPVMFNETLEATKGGGGCHGGTYFIGLMTVMDASVMQLAEFVVGRALQKYADERKNNFLGYHCLSWDMLPDFVFEKGRRVALLQRQRLHEDHRRYFQPPPPHSSSATVSPQSCGYAAYVSSSSQPYSSSSTNNNNGAYHYNHNGAGVYYPPPQSYRHASRGKKSTAFTRNNKKR